MTYLPLYIDKYRNMDSAFPLDYTINRLESGYPAHRHDYLELSYVISGEGTETINGTVHPMKPGTFTFILPYQIHELHTKPGEPLVLYNVRFSAGLFAELETEAVLQRMLAGSDPSLPAYHQFEEVAAAAMKRSFDRFYEEYGRADSWRLLKMKVTLLDILIEFDRSRKQAASDRAAAAATTGSRLYLDIIRYIQHHFKEELTLNSVAGHFGISPAYLSALFKKKAGRTFLQHVHDVRLGHACGLLRSTGMKIADIAMEAGYGSYNTFSRLFREQKGTTPNDYRRLSEEPRRP
ncbi:MAG: AraC family transcriptional regulator [Paenibacillus sp.]|jgi:AraC-like DNA-binding protein|uniref:AraC family transcriptional regulator n=1 Tax=Paenibacillus sp. GCM10012303 TaxID=3317340 RepID=UPI0029E8455A|nr:AraC family transcriptional regulator [Paenibacillus sp.]